MGFRKSIAMIVKSLEEKFKGTEAAPQTGTKVCTTRSDQRKSQDGVATPPRTSPIRFGKSGITLPGTASSSTSTCLQEHDIEAEPSTTASEQSTANTSASPAEASVDHPSSITSNDDWFDSTQLSGGTQVEGTNDSLQASRMPLSDDKASPDSSDDTSNNNVVPASLKKHFLTNPVREKVFQIRTQKELDKVRAINRELELEKAFGKAAVDYLLNSRSLAWANRDQWINAYNQVVAAHNQKHDENKSNLDLIDAAYQALQGMQQDLEVEKQYSSHLLETIRNANGLSEEKQAIIDNQAAEIEDLKRLLMRAGDEKQFAEDDAASWKKAYDGADAEVEELEANLNELRGDLQELEERLADYEQQANEVETFQDLDTPVSENNQDAAEVCVMEDYTTDFEDMDCSGISLDGRHGSEDAREETYNFTDVTGDHAEDAGPADAPQSNLQRGLNNMKTIQERLIEQNDLLRQNMEWLTDRNADLENLLQEAMIDRRAQWIDDEEHAKRNEDGEMIVPNGGTVRPNQARDDQQAIEHLREHIGKLNSANTQLANDMHRIKEASEEAGNEVQMLSRRLAARESCLRKCDGSGLPLENVCQHSDRLYCVLQDMEALKKQDQEELAVLRAQNTELSESEAKGVHDAIESNVKVRGLEAQITTLAERNEWLENEQAIMMNTLTQRTHGLDAADLDQHFESKYKNALDRADQVAEGYQIKLHDQACMIHMRSYELENAEVEIERRRLRTEGLEINNAVLKAKVDAFESRYAMDLLNQQLPIDLRDQVEKLSEEQMMVARDVNTMYYSLVGMDPTPGTVPDWMQ